MLGNLDAVLNMLGNRVTDVAQLGLRNQGGDGTGMASAKALSFTGIATTAGSWVICARPDSHASIGHLALCCIMSSWWPQRALFRFGCLPASPCQYKKTCMCVQTISRYLPTNLFTYIGLRILVQNSWPAPSMFSSADLCGFEATQGHTEFHTVRGGPPVCTKP